MGTQPPRPSLGGAEKASVGEGRVLVVFEDRADVPSLAWLRPGFRHCFCLVRRPVGWLVCDLLKSSVFMDVVDPYEEADLIAHYCNRGRTVLVGSSFTDRSRSASLRLLTCVEIVKRIIGLRAPTVLTPYQLYRALVRVGFREGVEPKRKAVDERPK